MTQTLKQPDRQTFEELQRLLIHQRQLALAHAEGGLELDPRETNPGDEVDFAQFLRDAALLAGISERHGTRLAAIEDGLKRLHNEGYGVCQECGDEIAIERLRAVPFTKYCRDCQADREKEGLRDGNRFLVQESYLETSESPDGNEDASEFWSKADGESEKSAAKLFPRQSSYRRKRSGELKPNRPAVGRRRMPHNAVKAS